MREIHKKTYSSMFREIDAGNKTFDVRLADFAVEPGDVIVLDEIDDVTRLMTGRSIRKTVGYIVQTKGVSFFTQSDIEKYGLQILSLLDEANS